MVKLVSNTLTDCSQKSRAYLSQLRDMCCKGVIHHIWISEDDTRHKLSLFVSHIFAQVGSVLYGCALRRCSCRLASAANIERQV